MKAVGHIALFTTSFVLFGCVTTWATDAPEKCPKHHVQLKTARGYKPSPNTHVDPSDDYLEIDHTRFPFAIPFGFTPSKSDVFTVPTRVRFCPECEQGEQRAFSNSATKSGPTDSRVLRLAEDVARKLNLVVWRGVYAAFTGPSYETRAEYRYLRKIGADYGRTI